MEHTYRATVPCWGMQEIVFNGPAEGNPFDREIRAEFIMDGQTTAVTGFYDGDGRYVARYMPERAGECAYRVCADFLSGDVCGSFRVTEAEPGVHGPVRVADTFHFAYADGTRYMPVGTTCYVWQLQSEESFRRTLAALEASPFNKIRFCVFPKHYDYNHNEPFAYPFQALPPQGDERWRWDFDRFDPAYFRHLERAVAELAARGIEADVIVLHPYDRWGFSRMTRSQDLRYVRYLVSRLSAFRNVWWSLANEYDFMDNKSLEDWTVIGRTVHDCDPYAHLISNHNGVRIYEHDQPFITHCCIQSGCPEQVDAWRRQFGKPVILDEMGYEGDVPHGWGSLTAEEEVRRFWDATVQGGYAGHGETYLKDNGLLWWSHGDTLHGESPARLRFLRDMLQALPGPLMHREAGWDERCATLEGHTEEAPPLLLYYTSILRPAYRDYRLPEHASYRVQVLDTWNMTRTDCGVHAGSFRIQLPARPYVAILMTRVD